MFVYKVHSVIVALGFNKNLIDTYKEFFFSSITNIINYELIIVAGGHYGFC